MSASAWWEPISAKRHLLSLGAAGSFMEALHSAHPAEILDAEAVPVLRAMRATTTYVDWKKACEELLDAIEKHGEVRIGLAY